MMALCTRILTASTAAIILVGCAYGREIGRDNARTAAATSRCPAEKVVVIREATKGWMSGGYWVDVCGETILIREGPDRWYDVTAKAAEYDDNPILPKEKAVHASSPQGKPSPQPSKVQVSKGSLQEPAVDPAVLEARMAAIRAKAEEAEAELREPCRAVLKVSCDSSLSIKACKELTADARVVFSGEKRNLSSDRPLCGFFPVHSVELSFLRGEMEFRSNYSDGIAHRLCLSKMSFLWTGQENVLYQKAEEAQTCNAVPAMARFMQSAMTFSRTMQPIFAKYLLQDYMNGQLTVHLRGTEETEIEFGLGGEGLRNGGMILVRSRERFSTVHDQSFNETFAEARTRTVHDKSDNLQKAVDTR
jgi:hypothetical protein